MMRHIHIKALFRKGKNAFTSFYLSCGSSKACPICEWSGHSFLKKSYPYKPAPAYICPRCGSYERHRFAYFALSEVLIRKSEKVLHIAPESCLEPWFRNISKEYVSVDLCSSRAMRQMDITDLQFEDNAFSLVWCSHVLEHVDNDKKAISELFRILSPSGIAVVMVPIYGDATYEDLSIKTPEERLRHFKQEDHVRLYGLDISNRLVDVGFRVDVMSTLSISKDKKTRFMLEYPSTKEIFLCTKI